MHLKSAKKDFVFELLTEISQGMYGKFYLYLTEKKTKFHLLSYVKKKIGEVSISGYGLFQLTRNHNSGL